MSLTTGVNNPAPRPLSKEKLRFQGDDSPALSRGVGGPMGLLGSLARGIGRMSPPQTVEKFFLNTSKEGPMAIVPLESSVIVGRSERAYRRDGILELQERVTEEIAAAVVWLFGVGYLQNKFESVSNALNKGKNKHLSTNIAWNQAWAKAKNVDLSPQEMFAKNKKEINVLLGLKSARWLFSVGTALVAVGYLIPKGNQLKTNFILKHLERRKRSAEGSNVQFGDPSHPKQPNGAQPGVGQLPMPQRLSRYFSPALIGSVGSATPNLSSQAVTNQIPNPRLNPKTLLGAPVQTGSNNQAVNPFQSNHSPILGQQNSNYQTPTQATPGVRFSGGIPGLSLVQGMGHLVEQTPYGSILVVDAGIAGGRSYVASKRSPYETAEVLFRDIGSLYFYILCAPQLMKLMTSGLDPIFKSSSHLQPKVAELIHYKIDQAVQKGQTLDKILFGIGDDLMAPEGPLKASLRLAKSGDLRALLHQEAAVYMMGHRALPPEVQEALTNHLSPKSHVIDPGNIQHLLNAIEDGQNAFGKLNNTERRDLSIALKQAFRHTVGMKLSLQDEAIKGHDLFKGLFEKLGEEKLGEGKPFAAEIPHLVDRIKHMATMDGMNQTHSMIRRSINVMRTKLLNDPLLQHGDALADWIDKALHHEQTLAEFLPDQLSKLGEQLHQLKLTGKPFQKALDALGVSSSDSLRSLPQQAMESTTSTEVKVLQKKLLEGLQKAMQSAKPEQLRVLQRTLEELGNQKNSKVQELLPFKTKASQIQTIKIKIKGMVPFVKSQAVKTHELKESLAGLNTLLTGEGESDTLSALKGNITGFMEKLTEKASETEKILLTIYRDEVKAIIGNGEGRLFSLATQHEDTALGQKLREMLRGGMMNDSQLVSKSLDIVGQLETDTRKIPGTKNADKMRKEIEQYAEALIKRFKQPGMTDLTGSSLQRELDGFYNLNRNLHFGARGLSLAVTMACIGWLVPIMQTKITKHLTGKDKNPGIASAKKIVDDASTPATPGKTAPAFAVTPNRPNWNTSPTVYSPAVKPAAQAAY